MFYLIEYPYNYNLISIKANVKTIIPEILSKVALE